MLTTLVASVGAGGIPSGSFVTMPLIFAAVELPVDKIPILLTVDWLLDRCRTTSNVLGDMTVAVLLDRVSPPPDGDGLAESADAGTVVALPLRRCRSGEKVSHGTRARASGPWASVDASAVATCSPAVDFCSISSVLLLSFLSTPPSKQSKHRSRGSSADISRPQVDIVAVRPWRNRSRQREIAQGQDLPLAETVH